MAEETVKEDKSPITPTETGSSIFSIDLRPKFIELPKLGDDKTKVNIRYPLIAPFAFAHIYWDDKEKSIVYDVEEPKISETDTKLLKLIKMGLEEMINISFVKSKKHNVLLEYLEKNVQSILIELGAKVDDATYQKLMYYIYRDAVGFNDVEPMMMDYYIEDIECNGVGFPVYIVHRKYANLKTNLVYKELKELADFIEKLAQRAGRYVSYARPLLDGTLPDGSRVNATYSEDVTTRGPTYTIRKFTKEPWTPIHLIRNNTAPAPSFAFIWLAIESKLNVMVIGETASGKTTFLNTILHFIPPEARICSIEDTRELNISHDNWLPAVTREGFGIPNIAGKTYGEVTLFDLLKETFRQNPDYVIVGEVRGNEAYVLFQGMASGHPSFGTFHAGGVETLVRRLETPPINLPGTLIESLDVVCVCIHLKEKRKSIRRLKQVVEIIEVSQELGKIDSNVMFEWVPTDDEFATKEDSYVMKKISDRTGQSIEEIKEELEKRTRLLEALADKNILSHKEVTKIISGYYKNPQGVLEEFGIK